MHVQQQNLVMQMQNVAISFPSITGIQYNISYTAASSIVWVLLHRQSIGGVTSD